jgi:hypothetical protein
MAPAEKEGIMSTQSASEPQAPGAGQSPGTGQSSRTRASDEEREQIAQILRAAMTEGRLNLEEGEERLAAGYAAKFRDELAPLTADLPGEGRPALADTPEVKAFFRRHLRRHASVVAVVAAALIGLWALSGAEFFWPALPLAFLVFSLIARIRFYRYARWAGYWPGAAWRGGGWPGGPWRGGRWR